MGCVTSQEAQLTNSPGELRLATKLEQNQPTSNSSNNDAPSTVKDPPKFLHVLEKPTLLVRDQFHSKYDGTLMYKWRKVDILRVDEDDYSKILVHFQGWADSFDQWMDLHREIHKIAPVMLLSKADCSSGKALTEEELQITRDYLLTGQFGAQQAMTDVSRPPSRRESSFSSLPIEFFTEGKMLDILDIFVAVSSKEQKKKWRKARIISVNDRKIRITYIGWDAKFDETLDIFENADRISPLGSKTTEQFARSLSALKESPHKQSSFHTLNNDIGAKANATTEEEEESSGDEEEDEEDTEADNEGAESVSIQNASVSTNTGGFFQRLSRLIGGGSSNDNSSGAGTSAVKSSKKLNRAGDVVTTQNGQKKKKRRHGKYSSFEEARADAIKKSAEEKAAELEKERKFLEALGCNRLHVIEMEGDGNCLFRAISHQLYLTEDNHEILRRNCVEHLLAHKNRFCHFCADDFDEHIREMAKVGTWGDELEIRAMEEILDRHITIYSSEATKLDEPINTNIEEEAILKGVTPIMLSYHGQNHYNSIFDEKCPLPLSLRGTSLLLQSRMGLIDGKNGLPVNNNNSNSISSVEKFYNNAVGSTAVAPLPTSSSRKSLSRTSSGTGSTGNQVASSGNFYYNGAISQTPASPYVAYSAPMMYQVSSPGGVVTGTMPMMPMAGSGGAYGGYALSNGALGTIPVAGGMMAPAPPAGFLPIYPGSMDSMGMAVGSGKGYGPAGARTSFNPNASGNALPGSGALAPSLGSNAPRPSSYNHGHYSNNNSNGTMNTSGTGGTGMNGSRYQPPGSMNSSAGSGRQTGDYYG
jgi:hypothetical protein